MYLYGPAASIFRTNSCARDTTNLFNTHEYTFHANPHDKNTAGPNCHNGLRNGTPPQQQHTHTPTTQHTVTHEMSSHERRTISVRMRSGGDACSYGRYQTPHRPPRFLTIRPKLSRE